MEAPALSIGDNLAGLLAWETVNEGFQCPCILKWGLSAANITFAAVVILDSLLE